jgi:hypothetical protein
MGPHVARRSAIPCGSSGCFGESSSRWSSGCELASKGVIGIRKEKDPQNTLVHHFLVYSISADGQVLDTINGNSDRRRILVKKLGVRDVQYFYSVDTMLRLTDTYPR